MKFEILQLSILIFLAGVFSKIYDDINDNDIFEKISFLKNNKKCINEFLKGIHYILLTFVSSKYIYPLIIILISNIICFLFDKKAFNMPYEFSGIILFTLLCIYLLVNNLSVLYNFYNIKIGVIIIFYLCLTYLFDIYIFKNIEFDYKKLIVRFFSSLIFFMVFVLNTYIKFCPEEMLFGLWYIIGYCITSCMFQIFLIYTSKLTSNKSKPMKPKKKSKPKKPKETKTKETLK
jgi:hypothetical protein